ncbi:GAS2 2 [Brachionus plicatilis]|uniref:GAS2 2 n=1 Tax=Brachionus plicatilis TaxID=10195 RepID=A0A3M7PTI6_BRAPC|nr:GAS2 2 [Brachionus plicatilis]
MRQINKVFKLYFMTSFNTNKVQNDECDIGIFAFLCRLKKDINSLNFLQLLILKYQTWRTIHQVILNFFSSLSTSKSKYIPSHLAPSTNMSDTAEAAKFSEMKSIQLYSTKDEYIYAMKEDLSEWFNAMYSVQLTAFNFIDKLENGVVICQHANNVTKAALKTLKFDQDDVKRAGVINIPSCAIQSGANTSRLLLTPSGKSNWSGDYLVFRADARAQSFQSRDNISNFIKWCRHIAKVRECLMFETDDLILRKNEKNFILCLLEVARFGSKFGIQVPTIIQLEQEIEAEIEREIEHSKSIEPALTNAVSHQPQQIVTTDLSHILNNILNKAGHHNFTNDKSASVHMVDLKEKENSKVNLDNSSLDGSFGVDDELSTNESAKDMFNDSLEENLDLMDKKNQNDQNDQNDQNELESYESVNSEAEQPSAFASSCSSTSLSSNSSIFQQNENFQNTCTHALANQAVLDAQKNAFDPKKNRVARNLAPLLPNEAQDKQNSKSGLVANLAKSSTNALNKSMNKESMDRVLFETIQKMSRHHHSLSHNNGNHELNLGASQTNLHNHVCSIADRCTCEKQFPVIKIGEGKYRIGNTKNIVFIRILRNHIMVRVGGGWDTLENYLNKHDPCRCSGDPNHLNIEKLFYQQKHLVLFFVFELPNVSNVEITLKKCHIK